MSEPDDRLVLARAKLNFARKGHGERCWDAQFTQAEALCGTPLLPLSDAERQEFLDQARHELCREPVVPASTGSGDTAVPQRA